MNRVLLILVALTTSPSCSMVIERNAKYSEFALTDKYTRQDVIATIGQPKESCQISEHEVCDSFSVEGRVFDSGDYWATSAGWVMTLGLHEIVFFPWAVWELVSEGVSPSPKEIEICSSYSGRFYVHEIRRGSPSLCDHRQNQP